MGGELRFVHSPAGSYWAFHLLQKDGGELNER